VKSGYSFIRLLDTWKGRICGSLFGILAGYFGIAFGFLIGYLLDYILEAGNVRRSIAQFLMSPETVFPKRNQAGKYSFFCLGTAVFIASGGDPCLMRRELYRRFAEYYPIRRDDTGYLRAILENLNSFEPKPDLGAHAREVRRRITDGFSGLNEQNGKSLRDLYAGLRAFAGDGKGIPCGPAARILRFIAGIWEVDPGEMQAEGPPEKEIPWRILGLNPEASQVEIKKVFRILAAQFHPDGCSALSEIQRRESGEAFRRIRKAYETCMRSFNPPRG
jgi:hypothetical protein